MTDEKLENLLKQALTEKISDEEIQINKYIGKKRISMGIFLKKTMAIVVMAAVLVSFVAAVDYFAGRNSGKNGAWNNAASFVIMAYAQELSAGNYVAVDTNDYGGYSLSGQDGDKIAFTISTDFQVKGENIDYITYSVKNGVFEIIQPKDDSILIDYKPCKNNYEDRYGTLYMKNIKDEEVIFASEYTVDYEKQSGEYLQINVCGENIVPNGKEFLLSSVDQIKEADAILEGLNCLMGNVEIICEAHYKDGNVESETITVGGILVPPVDGTKDDFYYARPGFTIN